MPAASSLAASRRSHVCSSVNRLNNIIFPAYCCHLQKSPHMPAGSCHSVSCHVTSVLSTSHGAGLQAPSRCFTLTSDARVPALSWHTVACLLPTLTHSRVMSKRVSTTGHLQIHVHQTQLPSIVIATFFLVLPVSAQARHFT